MIAQQTPQSVVAKTAVSVNSSSSSASSASSAYWHIRLFGPLHLMHGQKVMVRYGARKSGVLLARLALPLGEPQGREYLAEMLWPESAPSSTRANLRFVLSSLRKDLEPAPLSAGNVLCADNSTISLCSKAVTTDVEQFERALNEAQNVKQSVHERIALLKQAAALYKGDLLLGFYDAWFVEERERLKERYRHVVSLLARLLEDEGEFRAALPYASAAVGADALREESHTQVVRLHLSLGDGVSALHQFRRMEQVLHSQLNHGPSAAAKALLPIIRDTIRKQKPPRAKSASVAASITAQTNAGYSASAFALPSPLTTFFYRAEQQIVLAALQARQTRLLTLIGPSGSGKTRLAVEAAGEARLAFSTSVCFIPVGEFETGELLENAILDALGLSLSPLKNDTRADNASLNGEWVGASEPQAALLVLDGMEHLVEDGRLVIYDLLQRIPYLTCLVTSRFRLGLSGEAVVEVLPFPVPVQSDTKEDVENNPACQMLIDRIRLVRPEWALTPSNAKQIAELCRRLDGLPLAIELAAPWIQVLTLHEILEQLSDPFALLVSNHVDVPSPHRSLHDAIARTYEFLPAHLQAFFRKLSVFESGWTREAATAILEEEHAAQYLRELREYSLIHTAEQNDSVHFYLLDVVKRFAWDLLEQSEQEDLGRRHAEYYLHLGFEAESNIGEAAREEWFAELDLRMPNFRRALDWCSENNRKQYFFLTAALWLFWYLRGHHHEGQARLRQAILWAGDGGNDSAPIGGGTSGTEEAEAKILLGLACLALSQSEEKKGLALMQQSLLAFRAIRSSRSTGAYLSGLAKFATLRGDYQLASGLLHEARLLSQEMLQKRNKDTRITAALQREIADTTRRMGDVAYCETQFVEAQEKYEESLATFEACSDQSGIAASFTGLGVLARGRGDYDLARRYIIKSFDIRSVQNDLRGIATNQRILACIETRAECFEQARLWMEAGYETLSRQANVDGLTGLLIVEGTIALCENRIEKAEEALRTALSLSQQRAISRRAAYSRCFLALLPLSSGVTGNSAEALPLLEKSLRWFNRSGDQTGVALALEVYACFAAETNDYQKAASCWRGAAALRLAVGAPLPPSYRTLFDRHLVKARHALEAGAFDTTQDNLQQRVSMSDLIAEIFYVKAVRKYA